MKRRDCYGQLGKTHDKGLLDKLEKGGISQEVAENLILLLGFGSEATGKTVEVLEKSEESLSVDDILKEDPSTKYSSVYSAITTLFVSDLVVNKGKRSKENTYVLSEKARNLLQSKDRENAISIFRVFMTERYYKYS